jgi:hypothetical protein
LYATLAVVLKFSVLFQNVFPYSIYSIRNRKGKRDPALPRSRVREREIQVIHF